MIETQPELDAPRIASKLTDRSRQDPESGLRSVVLAGLLGIVLVHLLDLPGTIGSAPTQGILYLLLMACCFGSMFLLLRTTSSSSWLVAAALAIAPAVAYLLSRTVGIPLVDNSDIGNWGDPVGTASLFVEGVVVLASGYGIWLRRNPKD